MGELFRGADAPVVAAIDILVGLMGAGRRDCDKQARRLLIGHASSAFSAPIRSVLDAATYDDANIANRDRAGFGLSKQAGGIVPKIREMHPDALETPERQRSGCKLDDLCDALAVVETARRIHLGIAQRAPELRVVDSCGLPMEIWY